MTEQETGDLRPETGNRARTAGAERLRREGVPHDRAANRRYARVVGVVVALAALAVPRADADPATGAKSAGAAPQPATAAELFAGLAKLPGLSAEYREEKHMAILVEPVVSDGVVLFAPPDLLLRATRAPVWSVVTVRRRSLTYRDDAGTQELPVGRDHPARTFVQVFVDVIRGDLAGVERRFRVAFEPASEARPTWQLVLEPRAGAEVGGVRRIRIGGSGLTIATMEILDSAGDRTVTTFHRVDTSSAPSRARIEAASRPPRR
jgi:hypothetical protein